MFDKNQVRLILQYKIQTIFTFHPSGKKSWIKINPDYDRKVKNELKIELLSPLFIEQNKNPLKERCFKTQPSLRGKKIKMCKILTGKRCWLISTTKVCPTRCVRFSRSQLRWFLKLTKPKKSTWHVRKTEDIDTTTSEAVQSHSLLFLKMSWGGERREGRGQWGGYRVGCIITVLLFYWPWQSFVEALQGSCGAVKRRRVKWLSCCRGAFSSGENVWPLIKKHLHIHNLKTCTCAVNCLVNFLKDVKRTLMK